MKKYSVKSVQMCPVDLKKIDWSKAEIAEIREYPWPDWKEGQTYFPECNARVMRVVNSDGVPEGIVAKLSCKESDPTAIYHNFYDPVYKDSCLEFFFSFEYCGRYVNCEMNSLGASLIGVGDNRENRAKFDTYTQVPEILPEKDAESWSVTVFFAIDDLKKVFGNLSLESGDHFYANFFKCGDETPSEHYCSWAPIKSPTPNFHLPEFFGELVIE